MRGIHILQVRRYVIRNVVIIMEQCLVLWAVRLTFFSLALALFFALKWSSSMAADSPSQAAAS